MDIIINLEIKNNVILVCALCLFVCGEGEEVRSVPVLQLKIGDRPCLNLVLGLKKGQTLFKLGAWIEKGTDLV